MFYATGLSLAYAGKNGPKARNLRTLVECDTLLQKQAVTTLSQARYQRATVEESQSQSCTCNVIDDQRWADRLGGSAEPF
jgi:hypothetical protein